MSNKTKNYVRRVLPKKLAASDIVHVWISDSFEDTCLGKMTVADVLQRFANYEIINTYLVHLLDLHLVLQRPE